MRTPRRASLRCDRFSVRLWSQLTHARRLPCDRASCALRGAQPSGAALSVEGGPHRTERGQQTPLPGRSRDGRLLPRRQRVCATKRVLRRSVGRQACGGGGAAYALVPGLWPCNHSAPHRAVCASPRRAWARAACAHSCVARPRKAACSRFWHGGALLPLCRSNNPATRRERAARRSVSRRHGGRREGAHARGAGLAAGLLRCNAVCGALTLGARLRAAAPAEGRGRGVPDGAAVRADTKREGQHAGASRPRSLASMPSRVPACDCRPAAAGRGGAARAHTMRLCRTRSGSGSRPGRRAPRRRLRCQP